MGKSLLVLSICIILSCCSSKTKLPNADFEIDEVKSLTLTGDSNSSGIPFFQNIIQIEGLESLVQSGLKKNNSWKAQLALVNVVRTELGLSISDSKPSIEEKFRGEKGEKKQESRALKKTLCQVGVEQHRLIGKLISGVNGKYSRSPQKCICVKLNF